MKTIENALIGLNNLNEKKVKRTVISFDDYLELVIKHPETYMRNVFQNFYDFIHHYIGEGVDEYPNDPESINFKNYDYHDLFEKDMTQPFFADRLFSNRLVNLVDAMKVSTQQNKIYLFKGPPGSGKSTFLNNLLKRFAEYSNSEAGLRYEIVWRINLEELGISQSDESANVLLQKLTELLNTVKNEDEPVPTITKKDKGFLEIICPSHDNPLLIIPKEYRKTFWKQIFKKNSGFKQTLFNDREYYWVFRDDVCTICRSIYDMLLNKLENPVDVLKMVYIRPYVFNRRLGEGISVFNPCDKPPTRESLTNDIVQQQLNRLSCACARKVTYCYSQYAKTNNGVYALMDIKGHNADRVQQLHNIISEGLHKVEDIEENLNMLLLGVMNPEDEKNINEFKSFSDRIEYVNVPYVMDVDTEVKIYKQIFGHRIEENFLPRIMVNFARLVVSSRLDRSRTIQNWIKDKDHYKIYCDDNLHLLQMELFSGKIPQWLSEEDRKNLTAKVRRDIINEGNSMGLRGISGRDSINIFGEFINMYGKGDRLINMSNVFSFFKDTRGGELLKNLPLKFMESLLNMYNYTTVQEVKEALYYYNEEQISTDIMNYIFAVNFDLGTKERCPYTNQELFITEEFLDTLEQRLLGFEFDSEKQVKFRNDVQKRYSSKTLTVELNLEGKKLNETELYQYLYDKYVYNIKVKALDPFVENENFRRAIKDYGSDDFKTYDKKIRNDVTYLINNLCKKFGYTEQGAQEVCIYTVDNNLASHFE